MPLFASRPNRPVLGWMTFNRAVHAPLALLAGPSLDERALHFESRPQEKPAFANHVHCRTEKLRHSIVFNEMAFAMRPENNCSRKPRMSFLGAMSGRPPLTLASCMALNWASILTSTR